LEQLMPSRVRGFTIIELMTVLVVVGVLAVIAIPSFNDLLARRRLEGVTTDLSTQRGTTTVRTQGSGTQYLVTTAQGAKTVNLPAEITVTDGITVTYDQFRGASDAAYTLSLASSRTSGTVNVVINAMGRVNVCSPGGTFKGFAAC
jgi:prepilin-type N-terminal cleavage/methylation domain-containing protein